MVKRKSFFENSKISLHLGAQLFIKCTKLMVYIYHFSWKYYWQFSMKAISLHVIEIIKSIMNSHTTYYTDNDLLPMLTMFLPDSSVAVLFCPCCFVLSLQQPSVCEFGNLWPYDLLPSPSVQSCGDWSSISGLYTKQRKQRMLKMWWIIFHRRFNYSSIIITIHFYF